MHVPGARECLAMLCRDSWAIRYRACLASGVVSGSAPSVASAVMPYRSRSVSTCSGERGDQALGLQRLGPQLAQQDPGLGDRDVREPPDVVDRLGQFRHAARVPARVGRDRVPAAHGRYARPGRCRTAPARRSRAALGRAAAVPPGRPSPGRPLATGRPPPRTPHGPRSPPGRSGRARRTAGPAGSGSTARRSRPPLAQQRPGGPRRSSRRRGRRTWMTGAAPAMASSAGLRDGGVCPCRRLAMRSTAPGPGSSS